MAIISDINMWLWQWLKFMHYQQCPDSKIHGANMGPTWVLAAPDGPHVGAINLAMRVVIESVIG